jgi:hypothetical protein
LVVVDFCPVGLIEWFVAGNFSMGRDIDMMNIAGVVSSIQAVIEGWIPRIEAIEAAVCVGQRSSGCLSTTSSLQSHQCGRLNSDGQIPSPD